MTENAYIDENSRNTITALANDASGDIYNVRINPITGALVVEGNVTSGNTSIGSTIPGGTAGSVLFLDMGSTLGEDNDYFYYDPVAHQLALGHNSPTATLDILGTLKYADGNESDGFVLTSDGSGNATWQDLAVNTTFITNITSNTTFIDDLIANTYFTTTLAEDTNFYTTLAENISFTTLLSGLVAVATDGVTITGDGTAGNPLVAVTSGAGTVTSVSVVPANGVSGTVATATTTPAITLTLGAITPSTVNGITLSGSGSLANSGVSSLTGFTGSGTSSGTNTGNQTITLTGDVTGSGTGSFAATIGANKVTYAKMQAISTTSKLLGSSSTTTPVQEITLGTGLSMSGTTLNASTSGSNIVPQRIGSNSGYSAAYMSTDITGFSASNKIYISYLKGGSQPVILASSLYGNTFITDKGVNTSGSLTNGTAPSVCVLGSYVYTNGQSGGSAVMYRYDINTLANPTLMTISGTSILGGMQSFTDGTKLYLVSAATTVYPYTISGTTATSGGTITFTGMTTADGIWCDGTFVYQMYTNGSINRWPLTGGAATQLTTYYWGGAGTLGLLKQSGNTTYNYAFIGDTNGDVFVQPTIYQ